ncbi:MAG: bifunctional acetaldehyde-CoA/alcohol dehydrogenase [Firmicutes bacterium]|uniref:Aldehyde-alcohol dehydrogenase n=1 Tax=Candidatus Scatoplasma merdavium TaxID=2840932 RepID=A0A9D9D6J7_9BACL|nr:bifunctional acetaldehyde-CoA/alcohol dehydrogenase [Candidatus Scatoplasma merdavium]
MEEERLLEESEKLSELIKRVREAQKEYSTYSQEQVDAIFRAAAIAANKARIPLAKEAVEETGMGILEDKVIKNHFAAEYIYNAYKDAKTCGVIEEDESSGYEVIAEPIGVLAGIVPTTNPTATAIFKSLLALKTRNAIIFSPHPRAKKCTIDAAKTVLEAAVKAGAPENIIAWIEEPSIQLSSQLMKSCDCILATGGPGMVSSAYSSGKPAIGVGAGNAPVIIDATADVRLAVNSVIHSKTFDNGMICASEQSVIALKDVYDKVKKEFAVRGGYFLNRDELNKIRSTILINGSTNAKVVGKRPFEIAKMAGFEVPNETKLLIGEVEKCDLSEALAHEKLCPVLAMYKAEDFSTALDMAETLVKEGGYGHTADLYASETLSKDHIREFSLRMKACRLLINTPSSFGGIGDLYNFRIKPSLTLGCGSWGGNSVSENVGIKHLLNFKTVAKRRQNMLWFKVPSKIYFKPGCLEEALKEIKTVYNCKRVLVVTDKFLYESGFSKRVTSVLEAEGIQTEVFSDVQSDPSLACAKEGANVCKFFEPDCIVALGGGSPMDAAKIMWLIYEHPEVDFSDLAMDFMDIRKRIVAFPQLGQKAKLVCIPTTAGTGSEVTPFAVITGDDGTKYPITDYELLPNMAIVDSDLMRDIPKGLTRASGIDALTHCVEAYVSMYATPFSDALALEGIKEIFTYLPRAYKNLGNDLEAREHMAHAATIAGMAFANAFLGIDHSCGHKLGAYHHLPHGVCVSLMLDEVIRFNAAKVPAKMGTFSQYEYPKAVEKYVQIASLLGVKGKSDEESIENLISKIDELKQSIDLPLSIKDAGVKEEDFLASLDEMSEAAFNDQCTGTNPRYPLISEIKELYLKAYYGKKN